MEGGIQRPGFHFEKVLGSPLDVLGDGVAVRFAEKQGAEDEKVEGALQELEARGGHSGESLLHIM